MPTNSQQNSRLGYWPQESGSRLFGIAPQIGNPISELTTAALITPCLSESKSEFQLLELMTTFNKARPGPDGHAVQSTRSACIGGRDGDRHSCLSFYFGTARHPYATSRLASVSSS